MSLANAKVIDAGSMTGTATLTSKATSLATLNRAGYQMRWTGTPTGTFTVQASNNYDPDRNTGDWETVTLATAPDNPAGTATGTLCDLTDLPFSWVRLRYVNSSGTGTLNVWFHGRR